MTCFLILLAFGAPLALRPAFATSNQSSSSATSQTSGTPVWDQYHGNYTHNGYSAFPGPVTPEVKWKSGPYYPCAYVPNSQSGLVANNGAVYTNGCETVYGGVHPLELPESSGVAAVFAGDYSASAYYAIGLGQLFVCQAHVTNNPASALQVEADYLASLASAWSQTVPVPVDSNACNLSYFSGYVFASAAQNSWLFAFQASTGLLSWKTNLTGSIDTIPTIGNGIILMGFSNEDYVSAISTNGVALWNFATNVPVTTTPAFSNGSFYFGTSDGMVYKISGSGMKEWAVNMGAPVTTTPSVAGQYVYVVDGNGDVKALDANTGHVIWSYATDATITAPSAVASNGIVYAVNNLGHLYAFNSTGGSVIFQYDIGQPVSYSPVLDNGYLFIIDNSGTIWAFKQSTVTTFKVTFGETGLPNGSLWSVQLDQTTNKSSGNAVEFDNVTNGAHVYTIASILGYAPSPASGNVTVNGNDVAVNIAFTQGWTYPSAPTNLTASAGIGDISLSWSPPTGSGAPPGYQGNAIEYYEIYRGNSSGNEMLYDKANGLTYTDSSVQAGVIYFYRIRAVNPAGSSPFSNEVATQAVVITVPSVVTQLTIATQNSGILLSWSAPSSSGGSSLTGYVVFRGTTPGSFSPYVTVLSNSTSYMDKEVTPGQVYYYEVAAQNSQGEGVVSNTVSTTAPLGATVTPWYLSEQTWIVIGGVAGIATLAVTAAALFRREGKIEKTEEKELEVLEQSKSTSTTSRGSGVIQTDIAELGENVESAIREIAKSAGISTGGYVRYGNSNPRIADIPVKRIVHDLETRNVISEELANDIAAFWDARNKWVHHRTTFETIYVKEGVEEMGKNVLSRLAIIRNQRQAG